MTISPTVAYSFSEDAAIGATLNLGYADAAFRFFPDTSFFNTQNPQMSFFGPKMEDAGGLQTSLRLGGWWRPNPRWSLGAIYQTKTSSTFDGGTLRVNFQQMPGLGQKVDYEAEMDGFTFAAQAGVGTAVRVTDSWQLLVDVKRYFWDGAIDTIQVIGTDPSVAGAPARVELPFVFNWKDFWVSGSGQRVADERRVDAACRLQLRRESGSRRNPDAALSGDHRASPVGRRERTSRKRDLRLRPRARLQRFEHQQQSRPDGEPLRSRCARRPQPVDDRLRGLVGEVAVESLTEDAMNRSRILIAVGMTVAVALFAGTLASGSEKVGKQEESLLHGLSRQAGQQAPHRPGEVLRNDAHPRRLRGAQGDLRRLHQLPCHQAGLEEAHRQGQGVPGPREGHGGARDLDAGAPPEAGDRRR